jgi:hypothetical protein
MLDYRTNGFVEQGPGKKIKTLVLNQLVLPRLWLIIRNFISVLCLSQDELNYPYDQTHLGLTKRLKNISLSK